MIFHSSYILYIAAIFLSCAVISLAEFFNPRNSNYIWHFYLFFSVLPLAFLAGARDSGVGTDTLSYSSFLMYNYSPGKDIINYVHSMQNSFWHIEPLYSVVAYFGMRLGGSFWFFFLVHMLVLYPAYLSIYKICNGRLVWVPILVYLLLFYTMSLNMMRQAISISFCMLSFSFLLDKRIGRSFILVIIGFLFHKTALIVLPIEIAYILIIRNDINIVGYTRRRGVIAIIIAIALLITVFIFRYSLLSMVSAYFGGIYDYTINGSYASSEGNGFYVYYGLTIVLFYLCAQKSNLLTDAIGKYIFAVILLSIPLFSLGSLSAPLSRLAYYTLAFIPLGISICVRRDNKFEIARNHVLALALFCAVIVWYKAVYRGYDEVIPYVSSLLGIG